MRFPAKKNTKCIWVAIPVEAILHWYACDADRRAYGHMTTSLPKFLGWTDHQIFLAMGFHLLCPNYCQRASQAKMVGLQGGQLNPFAPGDFAEKRVLKLVEWFSGHCRAIKS